MCGRLGRYSVCFCCQGSVFLRGRGLLGFAGVLTMGNLCATPLLMDRLMKRLLCAVISSIMMPTQIYASSITAPCVMFKKAIELREWESKTGSDRSVGKGTCCQAWQFEWFLEPTWGEGEDPLLQAFLWPPHTHDMHAHTYTHTSMHTLTSIHT